MADEEDAEQAAHLLKIRQTKLDYLRVIDAQISQFGAYAPPPLLIEQDKLKKELGIVETVIGASAGAGIGDELRESGRFLLYHEQLRQIDRKVADLVGQFTTFVEGSMAWRIGVQRWLIWIGVAVFVLSLIAVAVVTYLAVR